jgi:predicted Zn finger-like uncharacterized protein
MALLVQCPGCSTAYPLKDELAGRALRCPRCSTELRAPGAEPDGPPPEGLDAAFHRHRFLLRQKHLAINEKYAVWDTQGQQILFVEREALVLRSLSAGLAFLVSVVAGAWLGWKIAEAAGNGDLWAGGPIIGVVLGLVVGVTAAAALYPKKHVRFYRDESRQELMLEVLQDQVFAIITATYTVLDAQGEVLAYLRKNHLYDILRKRWVVLRADGSVWALAKEDSILLSLLRRAVGVLYGVLRTNFIIVTEEGGHLGAFNRQFTLLDRYVLDLSPDTEAYLDRRVGLALGVMLDTGEKR